MHGWSMCTVTVRVNKDCLVDGHSSSGVQLSIIPTCMSRVGLFNISVGPIWRLLLGNTAALASELSQTMYTSELCLMCRPLLGLTTMKMSTWTAMANPVAWTRTLSLRLLATLRHQAKAKLPMESLIRYFSLFAAQEALDHTCALHEVVEAE